MRTLLLWLGLTLSLSAWAENPETRVTDYKVPCVRQSETWICAGELSEQPACIDVDPARMVCTGTPADSPFRRTGARVRHHGIARHL